MRRRTLQDWADLSLNRKCALEYEFSLPLVVENETWQAYEVSVSHCELLFFTDKGTVTYLVDNYSGCAVPELYDWERGV